MPSAFPEQPEALLAHLDFVRRLARSLIGDEGDDVAQDAWVAVLRRRPPETRGGLRHFLASTVRNLVRNWRRGRLRRERHEALAAVMPAVDSTAEVVAREALRREVVDAVLALEEPYRATVLNVYFDGLSAAEIARRAGVPAGTVRSRLSRGLQMLRQRLDREHGGRAAWVLPLAPLSRTSPMVAAPVFSRSGVSSW